LWLIVGDCANLSGTLRLIVAVGGDPSEVLWLIVTSCCSG
jgi:hypothetical protein